MRYAEKTKVPTDRSKAEIERTLKRYGAEGFYYGWRGKTAILGFQAVDRHIQFKIDIPEADEFAKTPKGRRRASNPRDTAHAQAIRQRWRALALTIKAKLEAIESGISTFEQEFLAFIVLPDGKRVIDHVLPTIESAYKTGQIPVALLPEAKS